MPSNKDTAFVRLTTGNHGSEPSIRFDSKRSLWEVNLRPSGPGVGPIFYFGTDFMKKLVAEYRGYELKQMEAEQPTTTNT